IFYTGLTDWLERMANGSTFIFAALAFTINLLIAFTLNNFISTDRLMTRPNFLPAMPYVLLTSFLPAFNILSSSLVASLFLLIAVKLLYQSYSTKNNIFNAAFLIGLASLFSFPALFFLAWAFLALPVLRPFRLSDWVLLLLGVT